MNTLYPLFEPLFNFWNKITHDQYFQKLTQYQGGKEQGSEWHSKYLKAEQHKLTSKIDYLHQQFTEEPSLIDVMWDNKWRLTLLAGFERLVTFRQAQGLLSARFKLSNNNSSALSQFYNQGALRGLFRGYWLHLAQFISVQYHSLLWSYNTSMLNHFLISSVIETAFYPLDTVKTLIYSDLNRNYANARHCLRSILTNNGLRHLYRGLSYKLSYNAFFLFNLRNMYEGNEMTLLSLPLWLGSYLLLTLKTRLQVCDTSLSYQTLENRTKFFVRNFRNQGFVNLYAGFLPFAALNLLFSYTFYALYSDQAKERALFEPVHELKSILAMDRGE